MVTKFFEKIKNVFINFMRANPDKTFSENLSAEQKNLV